MENRCFERVVKGQALRGISGKEEAFEVLLQLPLVCSKDRSCLLDFEKELGGKAIPRCMVADRKYFETQRNFLLLPRALAPQPFVSSTSSCLRVNKKIINNYGLLNTSGLEQSLFKRATEKIFNSKTLSCEKCP